MPPWGRRGPKSNWEGGHGHPRPGAPSPQKPGPSEQAEAVPTGRAGPRQLSLSPAGPGLPAGRVGLQHGHAAVGASGPR